MGWFLVLRRPVVPRSEWTVSLDEHLAWMQEQHAAGTVVMSGPSRDRSVSVYLVRAADEGAAAAIASADPLTASGMCDFELIEWDVHQVMGVGPFTAADLGM
ncbi:MAG TPA: YciI family protein [Acidimicrobiia bacterium]|jgi:uncharacterized protein YciI